MHRIRAAVGITLFMDSVLYLALVPFLPYYADKFDLSKAEAGAVLGALPVAILIAALPTGWLSGRIGARQVVIGGNVLFTIATLAVRVRALGVGAGGGPRGAGRRQLRLLGRLDGVADRERAGGAPGATVGSVMGLVSAGSIAGPVFGALGGWTSPSLAFSIVAVIGAVATVITIMAPTGREEPATLGLRSTCRARSATRWSSRASRWRRWTPSAPRS